MRTVRAFGLLVVLAFLAFGCRRPAPTEDMEVDIRGFITDMVRGDMPGAEMEFVGSILIEGEIEEDTGFDKAFVRITDETRIFEQVGGERREVTFAALAVGQRVEAQFTGPVAESYPVQATASRIVILESGAPPLPGTESPLPEPEVSPISHLPRPALAVLDAAVSYLAAQLGVSPEGVTVVSVEAVQWPDTSLGCPQPGVMYAQVITPGYRLILTVEGVQYWVHTDDTGRSIVICE